MMDRIDSTLIGTSDLPAFVPGASTYSSPSSLYQRIVHGVEPERSEGARIAMRLGQLDERRTAQLLLEERFGLDPSDAAAALAKVEGVDRPELRPWARYHAADFCIEHDGSFPIHGLIECKNRSQWVMRRQGWGADGSAEVGLDVYCQVQGQMAALRWDRDRWTGTELPDLDRIHVAVVVDGRQFRWWEVPYDEDHGMGVWGAAEKFYRDHILTQTPPPPDGSRGADALLATMYPAPRTDSLREPEDEWELLCVQDLREIWQAKQELAEQEKIARQRLQEAIGDGKGLWGEGYEIVWAARPGRVALRKVVDELARRMGLSPAEQEALEEQYRGQPTRTFSARFSD